MLIPNTGLPCLQPPTFGARLGFGCQQLQAHPDSVSWTIACPAFSNGTPQTVFVGLVSDFFQEVRKGIWTMLILLGTSATFATTVHEC